MRGIGGTEKNGPKVDRPGSRGEEEASQRLGRDGTAILKGEEERWTADSWGPTLFAGTIPELVRYVPHCGTLQAG